jgi:hypothetical protein
MHNLKGKFNANFTKFFDCLTCGESHCDVPVTSNQCVKQLKMKSWAVLQQNNCV